METATRQRQTSIDDTWLNYWSTIKDELSIVLDLLDQLADCPDIGAVELDTPLRSGRYHLRVIGDDAEEAARDVLNRAPLQDVNCIDRPDGIALSIEL